MTPSTLAAAMHRAGVGQHHDMTGSPYPYRNHDEEAEAIMRELEVAEKGLLLEDNRPIKVVPDARRELWNEDSRRNREYRSKR